MLSHNYRCKYFPPSSESNGRKKKKQLREVGRKQLEKVGRKQLKKVGRKQLIERKRKRKKSFRNQPLEIFKLDIHQNDIIFSIEIFYACSISKKRCM